MKKERPQGSGNPTPKGVGLVKVDVWLREEVKRELEVMAVRENRSTHKQAVHLIELGVSGISLTDMLRKLEAVDAKLDAILSEAKASAAKK